MIGLVIYTLIHQRNIDVISIIPKENEYKGTINILTISQPTCLKILSTFYEIMEDGSINIKEKFLNY